VLRGAFFSITGFGKVSFYKPTLWNQLRQGVRWFSAVPQDLFIFNVVCEFLGGIGLLLRRDASTERATDLICIRRLST